MAEFTFPCPSCHKSVQCDDAWVGHQINCPICQAQFAVPKNIPGANPLVPKPPSQTKLKAGPTQVARQSYTGVVTRNINAPTKKERKPWGTIAAVVLVLAAVGVVGYMYGLPWYKNWKAERELAENPPPPPPPEPTPEQKAAEEAAAKADTIEPPTWTLEAESVKISPGKVNGTISGTNFVADTARLDRTPTSWVLNVRQGTGVTPDRGVLVYIRMPATEIPTNRTFSVAPTDKAGVISQVTKLWKPNPRYAAQQKNFFTGYGLKLEFGGQAEDGSINGKVFLALPDPEKTVVGGSFKIASIPVPGAMPVMETPQPQQVDPEAQRRFQQRYGISPGSPGR